MYDSAGKFCPDIMLPSVIATEQKERKDVWAVVRGQEPCVVVEAQESWELEMAILCSKIVRLAALRKNKVGN
jgi:hypothetical protein